MTAVSGAEEVVALNIRTGLITSKNYAIEMKYSGFSNITFVYPNRAVDDTILSQCK